MAGPSILDEFLKATGLGSPPKSGFPTACPGISSGDLHGRNQMDWKSIENDKEKYAAYLCSREWAEKREAVRERCDGTCERCNVLPMDATHHLTYERKYDEELTDLQAICNPCHQYTHGKSDVDPLANASFILWLSQYPNTPEWLGTKWNQRFLFDMFKYPPLPLVFQSWFTCKCASEASTRTADFYVELAGGKIEFAFGVDALNERDFSESMLNDGGRCFWYGSIGDVLANRQRAASWYLIAVWN